MEKHIQICNLHNNHQDVDVAEAEQVVRRFLLKKIIPRASVLTKCFA